MTAKLQPAAMPRSTATVTGAHPEPCQVQTRRQATPYDVNWAAESSIWPSRSNPIPVSQESATAVARFGITVKCGSGETSWRVFETDDPKPSGELTDHRPIVRQAKLSELHPASFILHP
jgi:hypothetical protein